MNDCGEPPEGLDRLGPEQSWADFRPMIAYLAAVGAILTLAAREGWTWAYIAGLLGTAIWVAGFVVARRKPERWFMW
jgi:hypothetical protein